MKRTARWQEKGHGKNRLMPSTATGQDHQDAGNGGWLQTLAWKSQFQFKSCILKTVRAHPCCIGLHIDIEPFQSNVNKARFPGLMPIFSPMYAWISFLIIRMTSLPMLEPVSLCPLSCSSSIPRWSLPSSSLPPGQSLLRASKPLQSAPLATHWYGR